MSDKRWIEEYVNARGIVPLLARIAELMDDAKPDSAEEKELDRLARLVEKYEDEHYQILSPEVAE